MCLQSQHFRLKAKVEKVTSLRTACYYIDNAYQKKKVLIHCRRKILVHMYLKTVAVVSIYSFGVLEGPTTQLPNEYTWRDLFINARP